MLITKHRNETGVSIMEGGLTELFLGVTLGAYSPLAVIAGWQVLRRTISGRGGDTCTAMVAKTPREAA